jgi:hypothetical protein
MRRSSFVVAILIAVASTAMSAQERSLDDVKRDVRGASPSVNLVVSQLESGR